MAPSIPNSNLERSYFRPLPARLPKQSAKALAGLIAVETHFSEDSWFGTLTYADDSDASPKDVRAWLNTVRKRTRPLKLRYFNVLEYGSENGRAHFHVILHFNGRVRKRQIKHAWKRGFEKWNRVHAASVGEYLTKTVEYLSKGGKAFKSPEYGRVLSPFSTATPVPFCERLRPVAVRVDREGGCGLEEFRPRDSHHMPRKLLSAWFRQRQAELNEGMRAEAREIMQSRDADQVKRRELAGLARARNRNGQFLSSEKFYALERDIPF